MIDYKEYYSKYYNIEWMKNESQHEAHRLRFTEIVSKISGKTVLDVGAGIGNLALLLKDKYDVMCVDIKDEFVQYMVSLGLKAKKADGTSIPFEDHSFDTVILSEIVEHMDNPGELLKEAFRVAKKQVIFSLPINCHDKPWHFWIITATRNGYGAVINFEREEEL